MPIWLLVTNHNVVPLGSAHRQHLAYGLSSDSSLNRILNIADIDSEPGCSQAVHREIHVRLSGITIEFHIDDTGDVPHELSDLLALLFDSPQVVAIDFQGKLALCPRQCFADVVFDRLREV